MGRQMTENQTEEKEEQKKERISMETNKFLQEYLDNNEALHAEVKGRKGAEDTLISIKDVNVILERQKQHYEGKAVESRGLLIRGYYNRLIPREDVPEVVKEWLQDDLNKIKFMEENGLGDDDMINDITYPRS
jgi:hypothetical protein